MIFLFVSCHQTQTSSRPNVESRNLRYLFTKGFEMLRILFSLLCVTYIFFWFYGSFRFEGSNKYAVVSWLVRSSPDRAVRARALAGDIVLCSWARQLSFTVPLSTQEYKWVPANLMLGVTHTHVRGGFCGTPF